MYSCIYRMNQDSFLDPFANRSVQTWTRTNRDEVRDDGTNLIGRDIQGGFTESELTNGLKSFRHFFLIFCHREFVLEYRT